MTATMAAAPTAARQSLEGQVVVLRVRSSDYAVPIGRVQEIVRVPEITPLPEAPAGVEGLINLRGRVLPVVDLCMRLGMGATEHGKTARVVVVRTGGESAFDVGLLVDGVSKVLRLTSADVEPATGLGAGASKAVESVAKVDGHLVLLLDLDAALAGYQALSEELCSTAGRDSTAAAA